MPRLSITDLDLRGKRLFLRADLNVPIAHGTVSDDSRIRGVLPTIQYAVRAGARVILASHLGRPKGKPEARYSLAPVARRVGELLGQPVELAPDCIGPEVRGLVERLEPGRVLLLENLRFHAGEEANDPDFAKALAELCDIAVNDAFATAHRAHASNVGIAHVVPCAAGFLLQQELAALESALEKPARLLVAILGGAKVSDKITILEHLIRKVDKILVGGGMAFTFLREQGYEVGTSLCERDHLATAKAILGKAQARGVQVLLPVDVVVAEKIDAAAPPATVPVTAISPEKMGLDIGPKTVEIFGRALGDAKTIVWNGPMGVFECPPFSHGTIALAKAVAASGAMSVVGGGDTVAAVHQAGVAEKISYISTAGGAFLEFLEGKTLPGVAALTEKQ